MKVTLKLGDCKDRMDEMDTDSIDEMVSDPPYELKFMGSKWDNSGIAFSQEFWTRVYRVLKPGGIVKAFSGTRTFHRMTAAMEEAGFQDLELEAWAYACFSEDTEILTESGWKPGSSVNVGDKVACWDSFTGDIALDVVQETFGGPFKGSMVPFTDSHIDALVTPNHRVYHRTRYDASWCVEEASKLKTLSWLIFPMSGGHEGSGIGLLEAKHRALDWANERWSLPIDLIWQMTLAEKQAFIKIVADEATPLTAKQQSDFQTLCHLANRHSIFENGLIVRVLSDSRTELYVERTAIPYDGNVWCVQVPTGAVVVRRNGKIFISGNSGFPKSLSVSKALDKMKGAVRETKKTPFSGNAMMRHGGENTRPWIEAALEKGYHEAPGDVPATDEAKLWEGWGTALKPAWEPIVIGRKPC